MSGPQGRDLAEAVTNVEQIRGAYERYARGELGALLELVDPELEWTYLDPGLADPEPQLCRGRHELEVALRRQARRGLATELEEVLGNGDRVVLVTHTPGLDAHRAWQAGDRSYDVFTIRAGRVVALRACRDRQEALAFAGLT